MNAITDPASAATGASPVAPDERVSLLDVLRGFALFGILLMNIEAFSGPMGTALTGLDPRLTGIDRWVDALIYIFVQGKFYTLFSLLFGAGFALILLRAEARGGGGGWLFLRRTLVLLAIGLLHYMYVWSGDILTVYAGVALLLLALHRRTPTSRLPKWGLFWFLLPVLFGLLFALAAAAARLDATAAAEFDAQLVEQAELMQRIDADQRAAYGPGGSFAEANLQRRADFGWMMQYMPVMFGPIVLGLFLFGAWFVRRGFFLQPEQHRQAFRRMRLLGFAIGLPLVLWSFWLVPTIDFARIDFTVVAANAAMQFGGLLLCLGYVGVVALGLQHPDWRGRWLLLAPAGRMALTNYLLQSLICVGVFYGYGLGYYEQLPRAWQVPFVVALFVAQVAFSHWWLARFRFGPAEWLWRSATYLQLQPLRRSAVG